MKTLLTLIAISGIAASVYAEEPSATAPTAGIPDIAPFLLPSLEDRYALESSKAEAIAAKAEAEAAKARRLAADARLKGYKDKLIEITKTGDFDKAQQVKARITQLENEPEGESHKPEKPTKRPRPKDTVKFGSHTYALIKEPATWHVAKQRCEEMGGHLVCIESDKEAEFVSDLCAKGSYWLGASDEEQEGAWKWCFRNSPVKLTIKIDNDGDADHVLAIYNGLPYDANSGHRYSYVCEWESDIK